MTTFHEKPQITDGWVNGGFFVFERAVFERADASPDLSLEHHVLPELRAKNNSAPTITADSGSAWTPIAISCCSTSCASPSGRRG